MTLLVRKPALFAPLVMFVAACGGQLHYRSELGQTAQPQARGQTASRAAGAIATPPAIPQQPWIRTIHNWGGDIAVIARKWIPARERYLNSLAIVDAGSSQIVPFRAISCDSYDDVGYSKQLGQMVVCRRGDEAQLYQRTGQGWTRFSEAVPGNEFRAAIDGDRIAVISDKAVYVFSTSNRPPSRTSIAIRDVAEPPTAALLSGDSIFISYDRGEFGGALYRIDFSQPTTPTKLLEDNVGFLARSPSGTLWAASGIGHMGFERGALYRVEQPKPVTVALVAGFYVNGDRQIQEKSGVDFPGLTTVAGLAFGDSDRPIVVFPELGVFELGDDRFNARYRASLRFTYQDTLETLQFVVQSDPVGVVATTSGDLYVASRSLGVFVIRSNAQGNSIRQLTFEPATIPP